MTNTAPPARTQRVLSYQEARRLLDAALAKADEIGVPASIAVLDVTREIVAFARQDRAPVLTGEVATAKAFTAASLRQPSGGLSEPTRDGGAFAGLAHASTRGIVTFSGGFPLMHQGDVIGAVGASGGSLDEDDTIAGAAIALFESWAR